MQIRPNDFVVKQPLNNSYGRGFEQRFVPGPEYTDRYHPGIFSEIDGRPASDVVGRRMFLACPQSRAKSIDSATLKVGASELAFASDTQGVTLTQDGASTRIDGAKLFFQPYLGQLYLVKEQPDGVLSQVIDRHGDTRLTISSPETKEARWNLNSIGTDNWNCGVPDELMRGSWYRVAKNSDSLGLTLSETRRMDLENEQSGHCVQVSNHENWTVAAFVSPKELDGQGLQAGSPRASAELQTSWKSELFVRQPYF